MMKRVIFCMITFCTISQALVQVKPHVITDYLAELYRGKSGFEIETSELEGITAQGANPIYGEITPEGLQTLLNDLKLGPDDVFYDLGSGVGKVTIQVFLETPVKKSVGVELSETRVKIAQEVEQILRNDRPNLFKNRVLEFRRENIVDTDLSDATVIFMSSGEFPEDLMKELTNKFKKLKPGLRVITLKRMKEDHIFKIINAYSIPMTWTSGALVYVYELSKPIEASNNRRQLRRSVALGRRNNSRVSKNQKSKIA